ncbi:MAG TPA: MFS transporter, partial [Streptosporangiaceae bacterium]|nr:MFS transporter [Streptosporangiaceae bacterium]
MTASQTRRAPGAAVSSSPASRRPASRTRSWIGVWGAVFACSWGGNQFSPLLLMYEDRAHYSSLMVNAFLGVYVLGLAPALLISGSLSDRHGRRPVMLAGVAAAVMGSTLLAFGPYGAIFLALGRLFSGFTVGIAMAVGGSWLKELSQPPFDPAADEASGARRSSLAFTLGSGLGALVAGLIAQWGPIPEVLPFLIHIGVTAPFAFVVLATPETHRTGGVAGPWWRQMRIPSAGHRRFVRVIAIAAPWLFASAAIGYGYLPTQLRGATGSWGLVFATAATVVALGTSSAIQPIAKRLHSLESARGLAVGVFIIAAGIAVAVLAISAQSVWTGLAANVVIGVGLGITLVSGLLEVQRIATPADLAGLTGVFYALAYAGFLAPTVIAAIAASIPVTTILWV